MRESRKNRIAGPGVKIQSDMCTKQSRVRCTDLDKKQFSDSLLSYLFNKCTNHREDKECF